MTATADSWEYPTQRKFDDVAPLSEVDPNDKAGKESEIGLPLEGLIQTHPSTTTTHALSMQDTLTRRHLSRTTTAESIYSL